MSTPDALKTLEWPGDDLDQLTGVLETIEYIAHNDIRANGMKAIWEFARYAKGFAPRIRSALDRSAIGADEWRDISTCPKDGSHFLARQVVISDEYDEDDRIIRKGVREELTVVAYWAFGGVVQFPWNGGMPSNVTYILWQPLPKPPVQP